MKSCNSSSSFYTLVSRMKHWRWRRLDEIGACIYANFTSLFIFHLFSPEFSAADLKARIFSILRAHCSLRVMSYTFSFPSPLLPKELSCFIPAFIVYLYNCCSTMFAQRWCNFLSKFINFRSFYGSWKLRKFFNCQIS